MPLEFNEKGKVIKERLDSLNETNLDGFFKSNNKDTLEMCLDEMSNIYQKLDSALNLNWENVIPEPKSARVIPRNLCKLKEELEVKVEVLTAFINELAVILNETEGKPASVVKSQATALYKQKKEFFEKINFPLP